MTVLPTKLTSYKMCTYNMMVSSSTTWISCLIYSTLNMEIEQRNVSNWEGSPDDCRQHCIDTLMTWWTGRSNNADTTTLIWSSYHFMCISRLARLNLWQCIFHRLTAWWKIANAWKTGNLIVDTQIHMQCDQIAMRRRKYRNGVFLINI